jgi:hypothetical protein
VAVLPEYETVPLIAVVPTTVNEVEVIELGSISSLKVAVIIWLNGTPNALLSGVVDSTIGQTPMTSSKSSFAQPETNAINSIANENRNFLAFILLDFEG